MTTKPPTEDVSSRTDKPSVDEPTLPVEAPGDPMTLLDGAGLDLLEGPAIYVDGELLGRGAMGEVKLSYDPRLQRRVALKQATELVTADQRLVSRFLDEARLQSRLEHPSIVPVYDLGIRDGRPFFTMKRVSGRTLREALDEPRTPSTTRRLLGVLAQVCLTVEYAHLQGIIHRDIKPTNIMLGSFGEIYLLDWGIATSASGRDFAGGRGGDIDGSPDSGTPGYMAPEQIDGNPSPLSDIYALGAILFEIASGEKLHRGKPEARMRSTVDGADEARRLRAARAPEEIAQACVRALARDPQQRMSTARQLHDVIESALAGEEEQRRRAEQSQALTREAAASIGATNDPVAARRGALGRLGRALALDPNNGDAIRCLVDLLQSSPEGPLPHDAASTIERQHAGWAKSLGWLAVLGGATPLLAAPMYFLCGIRDWIPLVILLASSAALIVFQFAVTLRAETTRPGIWIQFGLTTGIVVGLASFFGAMFVAPAVAALIVMFFMLHRSTVDLAPIAVIAIATCPVLLILQVAGLLPGAPVAQDANLIVQPWMVHFPPRLIRPFLVVIALAPPALGVAWGLGLRRVFERSEREQVWRTWQLEQLVERPPADAAG